MEPTGTKFEGWLGLDQDSVKGKLVRSTFKPKSWEETDIDIKVTYCGICSSDLRIMDQAWGPVDFPCCGGHEITGIAVRVGSKAEGGIKVGDRVAAGPQSDSCMGRDTDCEHCPLGREQYCTKCSFAFNATLYNGEKAFGGFADFYRCPSHFVFKIPDNVSSADAAPMLCGGLTTYSALVHLNCGPGKRVGVIGFGGLGHFAVLWAKALGAQVIVISGSATKKEDAMKMGADGFIATNDEPDWARTHHNSLDMALSTLSSYKVPLQDYIGLMRLDGTYVQLAVPEDPHLQFNPTPDIILRRVNFMGSLTGSPQEIKDMLQLAADKNIKPWIEKIPMSNINQALVDMEAGKARYRYVLVNEP